MRVCETSGDLDLAEKPLRPESGRELGFQDLDGDFAMVLPVLGEVDRRHPAAAEFALDRVPVGECSLQTGDQIGQAATRGRGTTPS